MNKETSPTGSGDPVEYLLQTEQYHDWTVIVKDPQSDKQKIFGVQSSNLAAHSSVFRTMMTDPNWVNERKLEISNMSPETFNLLYRFVNGGDLPQMSREDAADLALAADMYMMPRLLKKGCKRLVPTKIEEVFPALLVVSFVSNTELEPHVIRFVQLKTKELMTCAKFVRLDVRCIEFIVKRERLSLAELEVWKHLVKWAKHQVAGSESKTLRSVLGDALKYVRFRTLTHEEIVKEVKPMNILTPEELSSLLCAIIGKQPWNQAGFSSSQTRRLLDNESMKPVNRAKTCSQVQVFRAEGSYSIWEKYLIQSSAKNSFFTIETKRNIELLSFVFKSKTFCEVRAQFYQVNCTITVSQKVYDSYNVCCKVTCGKNVFGGEDVFSVEMLNASSQPVKLDANNKYHFTIELSTPHMTYDLQYTPWWSHERVTSTYEPRTVGNVMRVQYSSLIHVREIHFKILPKS